MGYQDQEVRSFRKVVALGIVAVVGFVLLFGAGSLVENLSATEVMIIQSPVSGTLTVYRTPGVKPQLFGTVTKYQKRSNYDFIMKDGQDHSVKARFNDGANAVLAGSVAWEIPATDEQLLKLHSKYGTQEIVERELIKTVVDKAVNMTGPTMSSRESYAEKRSDLIRLIDDQINNGVYRTRSRQSREKDALSGVEKTVTITEIDLGTDGQPARQEKSPLAEFGIRAFNLSLSSVTYDKTVEEQIQQQQKATMEVQTAIATAKKAEQAAITAEKEGEANAAKAKWEQEVIKAKEVTAAEQRLAVARLESQAAEQEKRKQILLGEGEGERRRLAMSADGALDKKLAAWSDAQKIWAEAFKNHTGQMVPTVVMGSNDGRNSVNSVQSIMDLIGVKAARDLAIDMGMSGSGNTSKK